VLSSTGTAPKATAALPADDAVTLRGENHLKLFPPTPEPTPIPTPVPVEAPAVEQQANRVVDVGRRAQRRGRPQTNPGQCRVRSGRRR